MRRRMEPHHFVAQQALAESAKSSRRISQIWKVYLPRFGIRVKEPSPRGFVMWAWALNVFVAGDAKRERMGSGGPE